MTRRGAERLVIGISLLFLAWAVIGSLVEALR